MRYSLSVVGNEVVAAIERCAKAGDFRPIFIVAGAQHATIYARERDIAIKAAIDAGLMWRCRYLRAPRAAGDGVRMPRRTEGIEKRLLGVDIAGE